MLTWCRCTHCSQNLGIPTVKIHFLCKAVCKYAWLEINALVFQKYLKLNFAQRIKYNFDHTHIHCCQLFGNTVGPGVKTMQMSIL